MPPECFCFLKRNSKCWRMYKKKHNLLLRIENGTITTKTSLAVSYKKLFLKMFSQDPYTLLIIKKSKDPLFIQ